ncbi:MAG TPA: M56 family metallopeptidase, partial [Tepidisphaeraceae bacterium]|nr:M56 family metallopeptidase [Tepidisphaeraceae bacterium]
MSDSIMSGMWQSEGVAVAALVFAQTSLVLIVGLGLARLLRSRGPVVRSTILRAVLIAAVVGPAGSLGLAGFGVPGLLIIPRTQAPSHPKDVAIESATITPAVAGQHAAPVSQTFRSEPGSVRDSQVDASAVRLSAPQSPFPTAGRFEVQRPRAAWINGVVVTLWAAISGILLARLLIATVTVLRLRRRARPARASVCDLCDSISRQLGVRAPQVLVATGIPGPCLVGWLRPSILLPAGGEDAQREIFIHELAHVARRDCLWQLAAQVAAAPVWFQPLIWVMVGQMQRAAEEACDDRVMTLGGNCGTYVRTLADLAAMAQRRFDLARAGVGVVGMRSSAGRRIARLLATANSIPSHLGWRARSSIAMGAAIVVVAIAALRPQTRVLAEAPGPKAAPVAAEHVGRVIDADGKPVEGAQVWVFQSRGLKTHTLESTTTDADGKYAVAHAPSDSMEDANLLEAFAAGKGVGVVNYITTATREIQLRPPTSITLTITAPDDKPVSGLRVYPTSFVSTVPWRLSEGRPGPFWLFIAPPDLQKQLSGTTAADGTVTLHNLPQATQFELGFDDERFAFQGYDKRVKVSPDNPVSAPATVHLEAAATISGSVRFGPTGQPAAGVDVLVQGTHRNFSARSALATTDAEGRYRFTHIGPGEYNVVLELRDAMERDWTAVGHEWVKVAAGAKLDGMDFTLIKGGIVKGRVLAADTGQPITGK